jgi:TRAP-type uncharacterized transport system substrate-binding protein
LRVNTGARGGGATNILYKLLNANGIAREEPEIRSPRPGEAVAALFDGTLDAMVLVSSPEAPPVQALLFEPGSRCSSSSRPKRTRAASRTSARSCCRAESPTSCATSRRATRA